MKTLIVLCALISFLLPVRAQYSIKGQVTDNTGQPLPGATVYLPEINKGTMAGDDGNYYLASLPSGKLKIQFSFIGYLSIVETVIIDDSDIELNVSLTYSVLKTEEIVITGGYSSTQHENAVKIEALKINLTDIRNTPNFSKVLTDIPGVDMISKGNGVSKPVIRGLSMNDILVLNNGVRFENYQYSNHHPLGIDEFGIEDVEVIKGPASLLYGSDAIGGVINFIKEKPAPVGTIEGDYNLQLFSNSVGISNNFGVKRSGRKLFGGIRAGTKSHADYLQGGGDFVPNTRFKEYSIKTNFGSTGKYGTFRLYYDYGRQNLGLTEEEEEAVEEITERGRKPAIFYQQFSTHLLSTQNKLYPGNTKIDLNAAYQNTELIHYGEADEHELQMNLGTLSYETKIYLPSDKNSEYIFGFQGINQNNLNTNNRKTILLPDATINNYSVFTLLQKSFFSKLKAQTGMRYDYRTLVTKATGNSTESGFRSGLDKQYNSLSGSLGATLSLTEELLLRSNIAAAFRTPNIAELTSDGRHEERYEKGDQYLRPEQSYEGDLSLHYHHKNYTVDLAGFYNRVNDFIHITPTGDTTSGGIHIYKYMQADSYLYGGEAGFHLHPVNADWLHLRTTYSTVTGLQVNGKNLPFIPAGKLNFEIRGEIKKTGFLHEAFIMFRPEYVLPQKHIADEESTTNEYFLFDLSTGGDIKLGKQYMSLILSISNLFDKKYIDHLSTLKEVGFNNPGRNISLSLKIPFSADTGV